MEPTTALDTGRILRDIGAGPPNYATMKRHLAMIIFRGFRDVIADRACVHATDASGVSLILDDVTALCFEAEEEDEKRKVGFSKERRVDPQLVVDLLVECHGFPLEIGSIERNSAETHTITRVVRQPGPVTAWRAQTW